MLQNFPHKEEQEGLSYENPIKLQQVITITYVLFFHVCNFIQCIFVGKRKFIRKAEHPEVEIVLNKRFLLQISRTKVKKFYEQKLGIRIFHRVRDDGINLNTSTEFVS